MGIDNFHKWLEATYPASLDRTGADGFYDHVYIDLNCILHRIVAGSINERILFGRFYSYVDRLLTTNVPTKTVTLAIDGIAPFAKIILQRKRRLRISRNIQRDADADADATRPRDVVSPLHFTPGTRFMKGLTQKLERYLRKLEVCFKVKVDLLQGAGEAESKLITRILERGSSGESHLLVSTDADAVIMACGIQVKNIAVNNLKYIISLDRLIQSHVTRVGRSRHPGRDFMFCSLLMGNDYLPKLAFINFDRLWAVYSSTLKVDPVGCFGGDDTINRAFLLGLLRGIVITLKRQWLNRFSVDSYDPAMYGDYLRGLQWCSSLYLTGVTRSLDYMYSHDGSPHPFGFLFHLELTVTGLHRDPPVPLNVAPYVPDDIYAILVLPKASLHLIDEAYAKRIGSQLHFLYDEELCPECILSHKVMGDLHRELGAIDGDDGDDGDDGEGTGNGDDVRKRIATESLKMVRHKQLHRDITIDEIHSVIKFFA